MQLVPTSFLAVFVALAAVVGGRRHGLWVLFAVMPLGTAAALNLPGAGDLSILVADVAAIALVLGLCLRPDSGADILGTLRPGRPGFALVALVVWGALSAFLLPRIFEGATEVFGIARSAGQTRIVSTPLAPSGGNASQALRLLLGGLTFVAAATLLRRAPDPRPAVMALTAATLVHVALGWADVATFATGTTGLLEPIRSANYALTAEHRLSGVKRMIGGFPEASAYGYFAIGLFGFWLQYCGERGRARLAPVLLLLSAVAVLRSTSSSAYVAAALFVALLAALNIARLRDRTLGPRGIRIVGAVAVVLPLVAFGLVAACELIPAVGAYVDRALLDKLGTGSGVERMSWNRQALRNFIDTGFLGAGLGSVRASNWLLATLASLGLFGAWIHLWFLAGIARSVRRSGTGERAIVVRALGAGCLALFCRAMIVKATPNLELLFFAMAGMAVGLARGAALENRAARSGPLPSAVAR